jgi:methylglutaconyl-CoA hydratase
VGSRSTLQVETDGPLIRAVLDGPDADNTLDGTTLCDLLALYESLRDRPGIKVVTLRGAGRTFCSGIGRIELADPPDGDLDEAMAVARLANQVCTAVGAAEAVTLVRVQGAVTGIGLALMMACDLRLAHDDAVFRLPELFVGQPPCWGGAVGRLLAEVGPARTRELVLLGERIDAATAERYGMVNWVGTPQEIDTLEGRWVRRLLRAHPAGSRIAKSQLRAYGQRTQLGDLAGSDAEVLSAFAALARHSDPDAGVE